MSAARPDVVCLSHLGWDHVFQRPNHLMARAARDRRVFYVEEPVTGQRRGVSVRERGRVTVVTPHLPAGLPDDVRTRTLEVTLRDFLESQRVHDPVLWYYTPLAVPWTRSLRAAAVVYDCMDELSAFAGASPTLPALERELMDRADVVFTGGQSLYEAKRLRHPDVHPFPSAVDAAHFSAARRPQPDPADQARIPRPRLGWFGVIDERFDVGLVDAVAERRPEWQIVLVGPIAKIDPATLPVRPNIHRLGPKAYDELPAYLAGWDVAIMPFARNASTAYISPTKTPEYLAGGRPVVSTSITDVVRPYGRLGLVRIADRPAEFVDACEAAMAEDAAARTAAVDAFLAGISWDRTWAAMDGLTERAARRRAAAAPLLTSVTAPATRAVATAGTAVEAPLGAAAPGRTLT